MRYQFENYVLDTHRYELYRDDVHLPLRPLAFHVLAYLLEHRDRVISKDELFEHIWPGEYVGDAALKFVPQGDPPSGERQWAKPTDCSDRARSWLPLYRAGHRGPRSP